MYNRYRKSRPYFYLPGTPKVPELATISRDLSRRQRLELKNLTNAHEELKVRLDLGIWNTYREKPVGMEMGLMKQDIYGAAISPNTDWEGSFQGKRYFQGKLPNHHEWGETDVRVILERIEGGKPYFKIINDRHDEERKKMMELLNWYYGGRPGLQLLAAPESFDDDQVIVFQVGPSDFRRGRIASCGLKQGHPIVTDFDSGVVYNAMERRLFAMDEQFLSVPYRVFRCLLTNRFKIIDEKQLEKDWALFRGSACLSDVQTWLPAGLEHWEGVRLSKIHVERQMQDTLAAQMTLDWQCPKLFNFIQEKLVSRLNSRFDTLEDYACRVTHISHSGAVYLCHDLVLQDSLQAFLNDDYQKAFLRDSRLRAAADYKLTTPMDWFYKNLVPGSQWIVYGDFQLHLYRAQVLDVCMTRHVFEVELIDFGIVVELSSLKSFWSPLPHLKLPKYINELSPLCKRYQLAGVGFARPSFVLRNLKGKAVRVKIVDPYRTELVHDRYSSKRLHIPSVSLKVIDDAGNVTLDVNKLLSSHNNRSRRGTRSQ